jgi:hypothetical protein
MMAIDDLKTTIVDKKNSEPFIDHDLLVNTKSSKIHTSLLDPSLNQTGKTQDFFNTQDSRDTNSSVYNLGQRGVFSNPYSQVLGI